MRKEEFYLLAQKYLAGKASQEEKRQLHNWYDSFDDSVANIAGSNGENEALLGQHLLSKLKTSLSKEPVVQGKTLIFRRWPNRIAATVFFVLLLTGGLLSIFTHTEREEEMEEFENREYDNPDKAIEYEIERTHDLTTGKVPAGRLFSAMQQTQQAKMSAAGRTNALSWIERGSYTDVTGPSNGNTRANGGITSGRIRAVMVDSLDPTHKTVWVGGVDGGLWKTTDITVAPSNWTLINDFLANLAISAICQDPRPGNQNIMYFCTGESYSNADAVRGVGVFKSIDAGATWNFLPSSSAFINCTRILCDFQGNVYLATRGSGLQRSTDGGTTWTNITPNGVNTSICDLEISSTSSAGRLHMVTGIFNAQTYRYTDIPATVTSAAGWNAPTTPFASFNNRAEIAVLGNTLYACPDDASHNVPSIWKSTDGGDNWAITGGQPTGGWANGQGWYSLSVGINPANANECIVGGLDCFKTTNGGTSWTKISAWVGTAGQYVHADQHSITWWDGGAKLLFSCDGGVHFSSDGATTIRDRNSGLRLKQFYSVAIHPTSTDYFIAGAQDNGIHQLNQPGLSSSVEVIGGDGMYVAIDQNEPQFQFGAYVGNVFRRSINSGANWSTPVNLSTGRFVNPWDYDNNGNILYACSGNGNYLRWDNPQTGSTTTTINIPAFNNSQVSAVYASPYTPNRVYFGTGGGRIVQVDNANTSTPIDVNITGINMIANTFVNCIVAGTSDQDLIATITNYNTTNVWLTTNGGTSWTAIDGNLPDMPVRWALFHPDTDTKAYIATETGVWETDLINGASTVWVPSPSFPVVRTDMIKYRSGDRTIAAGTHGRGIWSAIIPPPSGFTFNNPAPAVATCPAPASMAITLGTISNGGFVNPITLSLVGTAPLGTSVSFAPNPVTPGNNSVVTLTGTNTLAPGSYTITIKGVATGSPDQTVNLTYTINPGAGPTITGHPASQTVCAGATVNFSVTATGTYQWQESTNGGGIWNNITNGGIYSGATTSTLTLTGVTVGMNANQYRCVVSNPCGSTNSNAAILTVNAPPAITLQPANASICAGNSVTFTITATGGSLTYQWQESTNGGGIWNNINNGGIYSGATSPSLTINPVSVGMNANQYRVIVTGGCAPAATSNAAILTVGTALVINTHPVSQTVCAGATVSFTVSVTGTVNTYQWQESTNGGGIWNNINNGGIYSGATTATLTLTGVTAGMNANQYRCVVTGSCPPINSNAAILTVNTAPAITAQPTNSTLCVGGNNNFCVTATGTNLTYQWQISANGCAGPWTDIPTATANCFAVNAVTAAQNNTGYRVVISGTCAPPVTSNCALLTVNTPVAITVQPVSQTVCAGANVTFTVTATGTTPTYQWQESTNGGGIWNNITNGGIYAGATTSSLTLTGVTATMNTYQYRVIVNGAAPCGSVTSAAATLTVNTSPAIVTQPTAATICLGSSTQLCVTATGTNLTYQWQASIINCTAGFTDVVGGTANCYTATPVVTTYYRCVINGTCTPSVTTNCATVTVNVPVAITTQPLNDTICAGDNSSFSVVATGTTPTYQWQVSTNGGGSFANVVNGGVYAGATTNTLTLTAAPASLSGNLYRVVVSGTAPCGAVNSAPAILIVHALPTITLTNAPAILTLLPGQITTLTAAPSASTGGTVTYGWYFNNNLFANAGNTYVVNVEKIGAYQVKIQEAWPNNLTCVNQSSIITIGTTPSQRLFIFPSPNNGLFTVSYYNDGGVNTNRTVTIYDSKGGRVYNAKFQVTGPYTLLNIDLTPQQTGIYYVVVGDANGKKLIEGKVLVH